MNTSFVISINSSSSYTQRLVINLEGKANLKRKRKICCMYKYYNLLNMKKNKKKTYSVHVIRTKMS